MAIKASYTALTVGMKAWVSTSGGVRVFLIGWVTLSVDR